jgi:hypothetical protein
MWQVLIMNPLIHNPLWNEMRLTKNPSIYENFWGWEMKQPLILFGEFRLVIHLARPTRTKMKQPLIPSRGGQHEWGGGTNGYLKRKVFLKNKKHALNIVEITHLCIMHQQRTQRVNASWDEDLMNWHIRPSSAKNDRRWVS